MTKPRTAEALWGKVRVTDGCWYWLGSKSSRGYGRFWNGDRMIQAHRYLYEWAFGPMPKELQGDHLCRVRECVNPSHIEAVTAKTNILRGYSPSAERARKTVCVRGHALIPENVYIEKRGYRLCRSCLRERSAELRARDGARLNAARREKAANEREAAK